MMLFKYPSAHHLLSMPSTSAMSVPVLCELRDDTADASRCQSRWDCAARPSANEGRGRFISSGASVARTKVDIGRVDAIG